MSAEAVLLPLAFAWDALGRVLLQEYGWCEGGKDEGRACWGWAHNMRKATGVTALPLKGMRRTLCLARRAMEQGIDPTPKTAEHWEVAARVEECLDLYEAALLLDGESDTSKYTRQFKYKVTADPREPGGYRFEHEP